MKDLSNFEEAIRAQLGNENLNLPDGFLEEAFAHVKQLLIEEGKVNFGALGSFQYLVKDDSKPKITFIPSSFLRQELSKNDSGQQLIEPIQTPVEEKQDWVGKVIDPDTQNKAADITNVPEAAPVLIQHNEIKEQTTLTSVSAGDNPIHTSEPDVPTPLRTERIERTEPNKPPVYVKAEGEEEEEEKSGSKRIWYVLLIIVILAGLGYWAYKQQYLDRFFGLRFQVERSMIATVDNQTVPEGCIACETLENNETLLGLAAKYYGNSCYWVYIFLENKQELKYPGNALAHTSIRIPHLDGYGITNPKESDSIKRALALGNELWGNSLKP